jgi:hypothetical protein
MRATVFVRAGMRADALDVREEVFLVRSDDAIDLASDEITESISDEEIAARCKTLKEELESKLFFVNQTTNYLL